MREIQAGSNFVSQNPAVAHFGISDAEIIDNIQVMWPDGENTVLEDVNANQFLLINHPLKGQ